MTAGHRHRHLPVKRYGLLHQALTRPTLHTSTNVEKVDRSRLVYGPVEDLRPHPRPPRPDTYRLSPLGVLHGLFGLTLKVHD